MPTPRGAHHCSSAGGPTHLAPLLPSVASCLTVVGGTPGGHGGPKAADVPAPELSPGRCHWPVLWSPP